MNFLLRGLAAIAFVAAIALLPAGPVHAGNIQMLPPLDEDTKTPCAAGGPRMLTWDGQTAISCASGVTATGGNLSTSGTVSPGTGFAIGAACPSEGAMGYAMGSHQPCYCNTKHVWTPMSGGMPSGTGTVYNNSDIYNHVTVTPVAYDLCVLSTAGTASCGRCVVTKNADGTWNLDEASCNPGVPNASYTWCAMTCY